MDNPPSSTKGPKPRLSRERSADGFTPGYDSKVEAYLDEHSPFRNPELAQAAFERRRALRELTRASQQTEGRYR